MDRQQVFDYVRQRYGTLPDYPWADQNAVLRHRGNQKWYGLVMEVGREKLGLSRSAVQRRRTKSLNVLRTKLTARKGG